VSDSPNSNRVVKVCEDCGEPKYVTNSEGCTCEREPDLPVAGVLQKFPQGQNPSWRFYEDEEFGKDSKNSERKKVVDLNDAEEAVREREEQVRREIREKIEDKMEELRKELKKADETNKSERMIEGGLDSLYEFKEELRDDLSEEASQRGEDVE